MREDLSAYFVLLILHAWGMALLVGGGLVVAVRLLGVASGASLERFGKLFPFIRVGAVMAVVSGVGLLAGYPAKSRTNWVFALKFVALIGAALCLWAAVRRGFADAAGGAPVAAPARALAATSIALARGDRRRQALLLYTNTMLLTTDG